jgi:hypothetical protein
MAGTSTSTPSLPKGSELIYSLPYDGDRAALDCGHSLMYLIKSADDGPMLCGLCFFREGYQAEQPSTIHLHHTLAENGNPETAPLFMSHLNVIMGLRAPEPGQDIKEFQRKRNSLARGQYTRRVKVGSKLVPQTFVQVERFSKPAWMLYPVASSLWKLMGYQPPLGIVLVRGVGGRTEREIASELDVSVWNVNIRMGKAIRTALGYIIRGESRRTDHNPSGGDDEPGAQPAGPN